jgi:hypothetical protein
MARLPDPLSTLSPDARRVYDKRPASSSTCSPTNRFLKIFRIK